MVKLSSPNLNYLILVGAALLYACVYLFVTPISTQSTADVLCNVSIYDSIDQVTIIIAQISIVTSMGILTGIYAMLCSYPF